MPNQSSLACSIGYRNEVKRIKRNARVSEEGRTNRTGTIEAESIIMDILGGTMLSNLVRTIVVLVIIIVPLIVGCSSQTTVSAGDIQNISSKLNCPCGSCTEVLSDCECDQAAELTDLIGKRFSRGESEQQIVEFLVEQYGQRIFAE